MLAGEPLTNDSQQRPTVAFSLPASGASWLALPLAAATFCADSDLQEHDECICRLA